MNATAARQIDNDHQGEARTCSPSAEQVLRIAHHGARRDIAEIREILLRLRHDWRDVSRDLDGKTETLLNQLDELDSSIGRLNHGDTQAAA